VRCEGPTFEFPGEAEPHKPPFDHTAHISGQNLFVSAYHGFATLGNEHVPTPQRFVKFPPFAVKLGDGVVSDGSLIIPAILTIGGHKDPDRYRLPESVSAGGVLHFGLGFGHFLYLKEVEESFQAYLLDTVQFVETLILDKSASEFVIHFWFIMLDLILPGLNQSNQIGDLGRVPDSDIGIVVLRYDETIDPSGTIGIVSEFCFIEGAAVADIHGTVVCVRQNV
jgi:hypothetical protein